eukprot:g1141.t1
MFARATQPGLQSATVTGIVPPQQQYGNMSVPNIGTNFNASMAPSMMNTNNMTNNSMARASMMSSVQGNMNPMMRSSGVMSTNTTNTMVNNSQNNLNRHRVMSKTRGSTVDDMVDETYMQLTTEAADISRKWRELQLDATHLQRKKLALRSDWAKLRHERAWLDDEKRRFSEVIASEIVPFQDEPRIKLNVGGIVYETYESVLSRDPDSMLAALCREDSPLKAEQKEEDGSDNQSMVFIDRSGKLFRHVLNFLRDGVLPFDKMTMKELYREAKYFEVGSLRTEIEKRLGIVSVASSSTRSIDTMSMRMTRGTQLDERSRWLAPGTPGGIDDVNNGANTTRKWWERPPGHQGWWPSNRKGENKMDWWTSETYSGKNMNAPLHAYSSSSTDVNNSHLSSNNRNSSTGRYKPTTSTWDSRQSYAQSLDLSHSYGGGTLRTSAVGRFR